MSTNPMMTVPSTAQPIDARYLATLRTMSPADRLRKAFELTQMTRDLFKLGLRHRFPQLSEQELQRVYLNRMQECHNRNY